MAVLRGFSSVERMTQSIVRAGLFPEPRGFGRERGEGMLGGKGRREGNCNFSSVGVEEERRRGKEGEGGGRRRGGEEDWGGGGERGVEPAGMCHRGFSFLRGVLIGASSMNPRVLSSCPHVLSMNPHVLYSWERAVGTCIGVNHLRLEGGGWGATPTKD